jgi:2-polyprenyl-3-methyl-5-hydroxy-6-metoxy-1,4-benzoquinol methylase
MSFVQLPDQDIELREGRSNFRLVLNRSIRKQMRLSIDIYRFHRLEHPEYHLGWWLFLDPPRPGEALVELDFNKIDETSVRLLVGNELRTADDAWFNPAYRFAPIQEVMVLSRDRNNRILDNRSVYLKYKEPSVLKAYYEELHGGAGYATENNTFLLTMHRYKLGLLKSLFERYFPSGSRVLDVGCGNSLFLEIQSEWPFSLHLTDLGEVLMRRRKSDEPSHQWMVADCTHVPFRAESFSGLFAGEIVEHVPDVRQTLAEWHRLLQPGGVMILTTPNLARLSNRVAGTKTPISPDHLNEMSYAEVHELIEQAGFEIIEYQGFHLELFGTWLSRGRYRDRLMSSMNKPRYRALMQLSLRLGRLFGTWAMGMIFVASKRPEPAKLPA